MQPRTVTKVPNLLGDERMSTINCDCGAKYDRMGSHKTAVLGFTCSYCQRKWRTIAVDRNDGQAELWFKYYECKCGSNILNIPPKIIRCICSKEDWR
jgi:hypothetical protein